MHLLGYKLQIINEGKGLKIASFWVINPGQAQPAHPTQEDVTPTYVIIGIKST